MISVSPQPAGPESNCGKFTGKADIYAQYRERYDPDLMLPLLREWCGLAPEWTVADIGTGTGMLGDVFRTNGNPVVAIEPNPEMRALCEQLHSGDALFRVIAGTAEETTLPDGSVDMIAIGRALHWFDLERALPELRRVLKRGGWATVVAIGRAEGGREENVAFEAVLQSTPAIREQARAGYAIYKRLEEFFPGCPMHHAELPSEMHLDWNALRGLALSHSHAPLPNAEGFPAFERALEEYYRCFQHDGKLTLATRCWVSAGRFDSPEH